MTAAAKLAYPGDTVSPCLLIILFALGPAAAQGALSLEALLDDTGAPQPIPPPPSAAWPVSSIIDQVYQTLTIDWRDQPDETLPFGAIVQIEHARAFGDAPEELFAMLSDGRRVVLARGAPVSDLLQLMHAGLGRKMVELPAGDGHTHDADGKKTPTLNITVAGARLSQGRLSDTAVTPTRSATGKEAAAKVVKAQMGRIRSCYQRALSLNPRLTGELMVRFEVRSDGTSGSVSIQASSLNSPTVERCVREKFLQMTFPKPGGNKTLTMTYPIVFTPGE